MAQRVATEYVNANLTLTEAEMPRLISLCELHQLKLQVFVLDNGNQEIVLVDEPSGESVRLSFERSNDYFRCGLTCRIERPALTDVMRKLVASFQGNAIVNRIYRDFTMVYHYVDGQVARIVECKAQEARTVYQRRDTFSIFEMQFKRRDVEEEISRLRDAVNELLDVRYKTKDPGQLADIDRSLQIHSRKLFVLEA